MKISILYIGGKWKINIKGGKCEIIWIEEGNL